MTTEVLRLGESLAGRYAIEREAGAGGMATVYLARDLRHDRRVALKVLHPDLAAALGAERFLTEIRTTANLQHPHILPLHDSGEAGGFLYYVMPFVEGETLRGRLERERQLPLDDALRIAREVLGALDYAHRHGVVHRDVKPENVLLHDGSALVADFGIALAVTAAGGQRMTQTGLSLGTPQYMAPEQAMGERQIDGRADVYASGAMLYEMLTGEPPFAGATVQAIVAKILTERPTAPSTVRDTVPPHVEGAVLRALAKLPADRFATAAQFADALGDRPRLAGAGAGWSDARRPSAVGSRRWRYATLALAPLTLASLAAAALGWTRAPAVAPVERYDLTALGVRRIGSAPTAYVGPTLALSGDGRRLAYVARDSASVSRIWVRDLADVSPRAVSGTEGAESVTISPDGEHVGFIAGKSLRAVPASGGSPTIVVAEGATRPSWDVDGMIYFGSLSADGERIARVPSSGGKVEILASSRGTAVLREPSLLPGGRAVLVTQVGSPNVVAAVSLADHQLHVLAVGHRPRYVAPGFLVYMDGPSFFAPGRLVAVPFDARRLAVTGPAVSVVDQAPAETADIISQYAVAGTGTLVYMSGVGRLRELVWVARDGSARAVDTTFRGALSFPALSPDGSRLAVGKESAIWIKRLDRGPALNLTMRGGNFPSWTGDGRAVSYYRSDSGTTTSLWLKPADGSAQATALLPHTPAIFESVWSPDGRRLVFVTRSRTGDGGIYAIRPGVDSTPTPLATGASHVYDEPALSPDGRWLAFASNESGTYEVYVVPFPNAAATRWLVSTAGGTEPVWSPRGDELFYRDGADNLVRVTVAGGSGFTFGQATTLFSAAAYDRSENHRQYDVSRDGRSFLMLRAVPGGPPPRVVLVRNWLSEARARAGAR